MDPEPTARSLLPRSLPVLKTVLNFDSFFFFSTLLASAGVLAVTFVLSLQP